uniref:phage tail protein n=1 Tax=Elizabethkingia anophelis TaxID=1117645 RepID=UPI00389238FD
MGEIVIKKKNTTIDLFNYKPFRSVTKAELSRTLMSDDYVDISVECANTLDLNIGDRVTVEGRTFFLNMLPPAKKIAEDQFTYELRFEGPAFLLRKLKVFNLDSQGNKTTNEFRLTGEINEFLYLLINNANKKDNQWILGSFPSNTETKTLTFNNENCLAVLQRICQEFNVEFDIVEAGGKFTLNIREKIGKTLPFTVEYGMGNGLYDLSRARANDSEVVTVLYAYGSSQNIPVDYRGYSPRLRMPVAVGDYISNQAAIDLFGYVEDVFTPDIKPTFKGKVSGVGSLANGAQEISVSNMDFDLKEKKPNGDTKYWIAGTPPKISVTKGDLAGYDFEVLDYIHATKTFKLKQFADDRGQKFPDNTTVFKFAAGDEFTLIDIMMPDQYITNAEQKLYDETVKEYQKVSQNNVKYTLNVDPLFLQDKGEIGIGDLLPIKDADFGIDKASRIISLKKDLLTDTYTSFDVADSYEISLVKEIVNNIKDLQKEIASQKVINRQSYLDGYRRVEDRFSMYFDADGKMDGSHIKADTIDVGMLSSGSKSRWFQLEEVVFTPNLGSDPNSFRATAGRLVHFGIKTSSGTERVWNLSAFTVNNLLNQGYYVYAKCDINGDYGTFIITPDRIVFDSQPNYYHFLIGNLYTASSGGRAFDANYGVSQMNGRMIFAGVISDIQGRPMIDLDKREIIGKVTFTSDSPALGQVQVNIDKSKTESIATSKSYSDAQDNLAKIAAAAYADGIVDAEEARAIADATAKMEAAKSHAQGLVNNI